MQNRNRVKCPVCGEDDAFVVEASYWNGWGMTKDHRCAMVMKSHFTIMCGSCGSEISMNGNAWALNDWVEKNSIKQDDTGTQSKREQKGKWIEENTRPKSFIFTCSECGRNAYDMPQTGKKGFVKKVCRLEYCPHCGTKMEVPE